MINPDKHIRAAFCNALTGAGLKVYDKRVPNAVNPGDSYVVISSQTNLDERLARDCYQLDCTIVLDLFVIQALSYVSSAAIDDLYEIVLNTIKGGNLDIQHFQLNDLERDGTARDLSFDTDTLSILRKVDTYRLRVEQSENPTPYQELPFRLA